MASVSNYTSGIDHQRSTNAGRSTFTKRQKEQTRQQRQRDKLERRNQRKQEKPTEGSVDDMDDLQEHARAQAALFNIGVEEPSAEEPTPNGGNER